MCGGGRVNTIDVVKKLIFVSAYLLLVELCSILTFGGREKRATTSIFVGIINSYRKSYRNNVLWFSLQGSMM